MNKKVTPFFPKYGAMLFIITFAILLLTGCSILNRLKNTPPDKKYVSTQNNCKFVVLPFNNYLSQIEFASKVENALLQFGFKVVQRPGVNKEVEERVGTGLSGGQAESNRNNIVNKQAELQSLTISKYKVLEEIDADYIVDSMLSDLNGTIRVLRKADRNIVGVVTVYYYEADYIVKDLIPLFIRLKLIKPVD
ncbi:MAG: hypothetical protein NTV01_07035 [Bacteroidia bacterium]|nr:hypothetical protein [Bacteroidia bacterium]